MRYLLIILSLLFAWNTTNKFSYQEKIWTDTKIIDMKMSNMQFELAIKKMKFDFIEGAQDPNNPMSQLEMDKAWKQNLKDIGLNKKNAFFGQLWFSPSKGEVSPTTRDRKTEYGRPDSTYIIWIEPQDPEFDIMRKYRFEDDEPYGIQYLGKGNTIFESKNITLTDKWDNNLTGFNSSDPKVYNDTLVFEKLARDNSVFYISTPDGDCMIMIMEYYGVWPDGEREGPTTTYNLKFKWKKLLRSMHESISID